MYNILIVDDEELICKGLKSMIERSENSEIGKIHFTVNATKVRNIINEQSIDIIITDIYMPEMSGLDLIKDIMKTQYSVKFIALSGYDDFSYVKEAFKLGVIDYILKPGTIDEIMTVLNKVILSLKEEKKRRLSLENRTHKYIQAVLEDKLNKVAVSGQSEDVTIEELFNEINVVFPYSFFSVGAITIHGTVTEGKNREKIEQCLDSAGESLINKKEVIPFNLYDYNNKIILLFNYSSKINQDDIIRYLNILMMCLKNILNVESFAAISEVGFEIDNIVTCHKQSMEAISYRIFYEPFMVIKYSEIKDKINKDIYGKQLAKLKDYVYNYQTIEISNLIDDIFSKENFRAINVLSVETLYKNVIGKINDIISDNELNSISKKYVELSSFDYLSDLKIYLKTLIFDVVTLLKENGKEQSISDIIMKYVQNNYHKDIDMAVAANLVSLSYTHFSKIFKDETGMNFSDYLIKVRMEKALEMLSNPVNKIQEVAQNVGYSNPKHFTRAFKNYFGFPPTEYRYSS